METGNNIKQPWQMTSKEWDTEFEKTRINSSGCGGHFGIYQGRLNKKTAKAISDRQHFLKMGLNDKFIDGFQYPARHRDVVKHALKLNLPVPDNVLKEYPELTINNTSENLEYLICLATDPDKELNA